MSENRKKCPGCKETFPATLDFFYRHKTNKNGLFGRCKACCHIDNLARYNKTPAYKERQRKYARDYYVQNTKAVRDYAKQRNKDLRMAALIAYSGPIPCCACCYESTIEFLAIDHIQGGGNAHRRSIGCGSGSNTYVWLHTNNYPDGFRVLCHNCNQAMGCYGKCPHEIHRGGIVEDFSI